MITRRSFFATLPIPLLAKALPEPIPHFKTWEAHTVDELTNGKKTQIVLERVFSQMKFGEKHLLFTKNGCYEITKK